MHKSNKVKIAGMISAVGIFFLVIAVFVLAYSNIDDDKSFSERGIKRNLSSQDDSSEFDIPDIAATDVLGDICNCMTPQGICVANDYILITAYCNVENYKEDLEANSYMSVNQERMISEEGHERHNSVVYVLSKETKEHIGTLVFDDKSHVGGITFDGEYIWVAKGGNCIIEAYAYNDFKKHIEDEEESCALAEPVYEVVCDYAASFITYYKGSLWVGTFNSDMTQKGVLSEYCISYERGVRCLDSGRVLEIPSQANGAVFVENAGDIYLAVTTSYGRNNPSKLYFYKLENSEEMLTELVEYKALTLPPMAEEICLNNDNMYFLFESAATSYSNVENNKCHDVVNKVRVNNVLELLYGRWGL